MNATPLVDSDTVRLRIPETEEDWNFVRSTYIADYGRASHNFLDDQLRLLAHAIKNELRECGVFIDSQAKSRLFGCLKSVALPVECSVSKKDFLAGQVPIRDRILEKSEVWLACSPADPWFLMGFAIVVRVPSGIVLHYLFVKKRFRQVGLGKQLLDAVAGQARYVVATHLTIHWCKWVPRLVAQGYRIEYNPYLIGDSA